MSAGGRHITNHFAVSAIADCTSSVVSSRFLEIGNSNEISLMKFLTYDWLFIMCDQVLISHGCVIRDTIASHPFYNLCCYALCNYIIAMVLRFVLLLSMCRATTDILHLASFAHPRKLIHENFCLKQIFDKLRNIISSKISRPTVLHTTCMLVMYFVILFIS